MTEYVCGSESVRELSARFGISAGTMRTHSKAEHWFERRREYRENIAQIALQKNAENSGDYFVRMNAKLQGQLETLLEKAGALLNALPDGSGYHENTTYEDGRRETNSAALKDAVTALEKAQGILSQMQGGTAEGALPRITRSADGGIETDTDV